MGGLTSLAWRSLAARRLRSVLTILGIALGVGVLFASLATNAGIERSIDRTVGDLVGRADLRVSAFQERGLSDETVSAIRSTPGVSVAAPQIEQRVYLSRVSNAPDATGLLPPPVTVVGIDPLVDPEVRDLPIVAGVALARRDETGAVISDRLARDDGFELGSPITIQLAGEPETFRVVGIMAGDGPGTGAVGRTVVLPIDAVRRLFELDGVSRVDIRVAEGVSVDDVQAALGTRLVSEPYVLSSPRDLAASLRASTAEFQATTALIAAVALFAGAFLIFNTLSMTVAERIREVGLLRAAGATRRQVMGFILAGAAALGVLGSLLGLGVGLALAAFIATYVRQVASVPLDRLETPVIAFVVAGAVGFLVTVAAAFEPAWRAGRISPVEALRLRAEPGRGQGARLRWLVGVFAAVAIVGLLVWPRGAGVQGVVRALLVYGLLLGVTLLSPFILRPLGRLAGIPYAIFLRFEERLARGALVRDRSRTALTVGALTVGLAMIVAIGTVAQNARHAAGSWLTSVVPGDEILTSIRPIALDEEVVADLQAADGVERLAPIATFDLAYEGVRLDGAAVGGRELFDDGRLTFVEGSRDALAELDAGGTAILPVSQADRLGLRVGDTMDFAVGEGEVRSLRVSGIVERTLPGRTGETVLVGWSDATESFGVAGADFFAVRFDADAGVRAREGVEELARLNALEPSTLDRVQGAIADALDRVFSLFDALALVAVLVAALGIVNTLTMNVVERVREIGVLRATGMTRRQVGRMVVVEAGILGLLGAVLGIATGLGAGAIMVTLAGGDLELPNQVPWLALVTSLVLGVAVSMLAAYYPARLAGRLSIVRAVQFE
jgi:putative ABC transport system permease protein